ncbi:MAG: AtpZ/AtpI family protein [Planctomycetota bacterium]
MAEPEEEREAQDERRPGAMPKWMNLGRIGADESRPGSAAGVEFAAMLLICTGLGYWADRSFGTLPVFLLVGAGVGFAGGLWHLVRTLGGSGGKRG